MVIFIDTTVDKVDPLIRFTMATVKLFHSYSKNIMGFNKHVLTLSKTKEPLFHTVCSSIKLWDSPVILQKVQSI